MRKVLSTFIFWLTIVITFVSCKREYSLERGIPAASLGFAEGTLKDSQNNCLSVLVAGHYYNDKDPDIDSNYLLVQVNVTRPGIYTIVTSFENGFMFGDSGVLTAPGLQTITLKITGKPIKETVTHFTISFGNSTCPVSIDVKNSMLNNTGPGELALNTWEFTDSTNGSYHHGQIIRNFPSVITGNGRCQYSLMGATKPELPYDTVLYIIISFPVPYIQAGTYPTNDHSYFVYAGYSNYVDYYLSRDFTGGKVVINVTSYDDRQKIIKGNFRGAAVDQSGKEALITKGRFYATVY